MLFRSTAFHCLVNNCKTENVCKMNAFLGENCEGRALQQSSGMNYGIHTVGADGFIPMLTIDSLNLRRLDVLQLDVEGHEMAALKGGVETIKKFKPAIQLERFDNDKQRAFMETLGYKYVESRKMDTIYLPE